MMSFVIFSQVLRIMQKFYSEEFDQETVCVKHFTVVINQLPDSFRQYKDELAIKAALWNQITTKIK